MIATGAVVVTVLGVGHTECCDCCKGRQRTTRDAVRAIAVGCGRRML